MRKQLIDPPQLHDGRPFGMSQAVIDTDNPYCLLTTCVRHSAHQEDLTPAEIKQRGEAIFKSGGESNTLA